MKRIMGQLIVVVAIVTLVCLFSPIVAWSQENLDLDNQSGSLCVNSSVTFTISVNNAPNETDSLGFNVQFDATVLQFVSSARGALVQNWTQFAVSNPQTGRLTVGGFTTADLIQPGASGVLATLTFTVIARPTNDTSTLTIQNPVDDVATWTLGTGQFTYVNCPPTANPDSASVNEGASVSINVVANDNDPDGTVDPTSVAIATAPTDGTATPNPDGTITYTSNACNGGSDTFTYTVNDNNGATSAAATVTVDVNCKPIANPDSATTNKSTAVTISVLANDSDPDGTLDASTVTVATQPTNGTTTVNADGSITYTPNADFTGTDTFTYTVNDNEGLSSDAATVTVRVNTPPVADDDSAQTNQNTPVTINVLDGDTDADGTLVASTVAVTTAPTNGSTTVNADGTITYTPNSGINGTDSFKYTVKDNDGATSNEATVTVTVNNVAPVANNDSASTPFNTAVTINVRANDTDDNGLDATSVTIKTAPSNGTATVNADGTVTYTPNTGFSGMDTFTYTIKDDDGAESNAATVTVTVNSRPEAKPDKATTVLDTLITINVLANDSDADGTINPASVTIVTQPSNGTATVNADGTVTYAPNAGFTGSDLFTYTIQDDVGATSDPAQVSITVLLTEVGIDTPEDGNVIAGNAVNVQAEIGMEAKIASVLFQFSPVNGATAQLVTTNQENTFQDIGEATTSPFRVPWDTTALTDGNYMLRAIATPIEGDPITSEEITVTINNANPDAADIVENTDSRTQQVPANADAEVMASNGVVVEIPAGALNADDRITVAVVDVAPGTLPGEAVGVIIDIDLASGQDTFTTNITIRIPYVDANQDGIVDDTTPPIREENLSMWFFDASVGAAGAWVQIPTAQVTVDTENNVIVGQIDHLTEFGAFNVSGGGGGCSIFPGMGSSQHPLVPPIEAFGNILLPLLIIIIMGGWRRYRSRRLQG